MITYAVALISGILVKLTDEIADNRKELKRVGIFTGALYGLCLALIIRFNPILSSLALAILIAVLITKKIDSICHTAGIITFSISTIVFYLKGSVWNIEYVLLTLFLIPAMLDEVVSDVVKKGKIKGYLGTFLKERPLLDISALLISFATANPLFFIAMLSFDIGYKIGSLMG